MSFSFWKRWTDPAVGGSNIKSIQHGTVTMASSETATVTLPTTVDASKSIVLFNVGSESSYDSSISSIKVGMSSFTDTTLTFRRTANDGQYRRIGYCVIEFENVKSKQSGSKDVTSGSESQTITAVNRSKAICLLDGFKTNNTDNTNHYFNLLQCYLSDTTTITFYSRYNYSDTIAYWTVLEFN